MTYYRGQVVLANPLDLDEAKRYVVVSNNRRNANLGSFLAVRMTTAIKLQRASIVELPATESFTGQVLCDDIEPIYDDEVITVLGGLEPTTMQKVNRGLAAALDLP